MRDAVHIRTIPLSLCAGLAMAIAVLPCSVFAASPAPAAAPATDEDAGQVAFNTHCRTCHSVKPGDNRLGPSLYNIHGAKAGQVEGFTNYSGQLTADMTWDDATLDKFIANPTAMASNTTMKPFAGIADADQRKLIIDYLKAQKS